ncbi:MAG: SH3 domain-containing protein [Eubacterium sp.]|nr:SH3 domain-containing protein [Eubacterium sp.]
MGRKNTYYKKPSRRARRRRRRMIRRLVILIVIIVVVAGLIFAWKNLGLSDKVIGSHEKSDISTYYGLTDDASMIVTVNNERSDEIGIISDGEAYLPLHLVQSKISNRFFWDGDEKELRYVTPTDVISTQALDTNVYSIGKEEKELAHPIAIAGTDTIYLSMEFVESLADIHYEQAEEPNRVAVSTEWGEITYNTLKHSTSLREKGGIRSAVIATLEKDSLVTVTEEFDNWVGVTTEDGLTGYIPKSDLGEETTKTYTSEKEEEVFSHLLRDEKICLAWHQVTNEVANTYLSDVLNSTKDVNVVSPTWFYLNGNDGSIQSFCSADYVTACHDQGIEVWGLVSNLENPNVDTAIVLNRTSTRDTLINNLIGAAIQYDLDGINVDFEALNSKVGYSFIEFIRELSIKCEKNDLVLSVDNYPPSSYTELYFRDEQAKFADYVILMAYDEHFTGSEEAGSVASLPYVTESVANTLEEVPAEQLVLGIPFYTRLWKTTAGTVTSENLGMADAQKNLSDNQATQTWLEDENQYYAEYDKGDSKYQIWLEEEKSISAKLDVMKENNLAGAAFWKLSYEDSSIWDTIAGYMEQNGNDSGNN